MSLYDTFSRALAESVPVTLATVIAGAGGVGSRMLVFRDGRAEGSIAPPDLASRVVDDAGRLLRREQADTLHYELPDGEYDVFFDVYPVPPHLVIVGASHAAGPLAAMGRMLGYRVTITDARAAFAQPDRFPEADQVLKGWPQDVLPSITFDDSTYVVLLSHDPKFDEPTLQHVLPTTTPYIGAIGSRKTQRERFARLRDEGFSEEQLQRIHGPVGLDLGAASPEETALAIMAEITAVRRGKSGGFLKGAQ
jgi:xanthine dehydrogenase accessory factor